MPPGSQKELYFFDVEWKGSFGPSDVERYHAYFPRPSGSITGEWTPDYMYHTWVPPLLRQVAPHARVLVCLRDPVERYLSEIRHWIKLDLNLNTLGRVSDLAQFRSYYAYPLLRLLDYFPREQVLVLQHERCVVDLEAQLRRTYQFLGLPDIDFVPENPRQRVNTTSLEHDIPDSLKLVPEEGFRRDANVLLELEPEIDLSLWPGVRSEATSPTLG